MQAQWEYVENNGFEKYPDEINVIIENAFHAKKPCAEWEEQDARFRVTFAAMEEETVDSGPANKVRVRRVPKGLPVRLCSKF